MAIKPEKAITNTNMKWVLRLLNAGHVELVETSTVNFLETE